MATIVRCTIMPPRGIRRDRSLNVIQVGDGDSEESESGFVSRSRPGGPRPDHHHRSIEPSTFR